jgi:hypothetical protein
MSPIAETNIPANGRMSMHALPDFNNFLSDFPTRKWRCGGLAELQGLWLPLFHFPSKSAF